MKRINSIPRKLRAQYPLHLAETTYYSRGTNFLLIFVERCGAVVKRRTRDREVPGSIPTSSKCCFLEQETLSTLLSTGFYPGKKEGHMED